MVEVTFGPGLGFAYWNGSYNEEMSTTTAAILGWILTTEAAAISGWSVRETAAILGWPPTTTITTTAAGTSP